MYGVLNRQEQRSGDDYQERLMLSFDEMFGRERGSTLGMLHDYWLSKQAQANGNLPLRDEFQPQNVLSSDAMSLVSWIDATSLDPFNFILHDHTSSPVPGMGVEMSEKRVVEFPNVSHAKAYALEYHFCRAIRQPIYHEIDQTIGGVERKYVRLLLPLADESNSISRIYYACRRLYDPTSLND